jgi:hypothetical protein
MSRTYLGEFEELVLLAVALLEQQPTGAYGVTIADELKQRTQRTTSVTGVHVVLYRLEEKGLVGSVLGGSYPGPGRTAQTPIHPDGGWSASAAGDASTPDGILGGLTHPFLFLSHEQAFI